jgi:DNA repair ATPase RecN
MFSIQPKLGWAGASMCTGTVLVLAWLALSSTTRAQSDQKEYLSPAEIDQIREAQEINERVPLYLEFAKARLMAAMKLAGVQSAEHPLEPAKGKKSPAGHKSAEEKKEPEKSLSDYLEEYDSIYEEMLRHLDESLDQGADARKALKAILKESPLHQSSLKSIEARLGEDSPNILSEALSDTADAIEGSQKTLPGQEEKFKQEKERQKEKHRD